MRKIVSRIIVLLTVVLAVPSRGAQPEPLSLPSVQVTAISGEEVSTDTMGRQKPVVLVLLRKGSPGGEALLKLLERWEKPLPADRVLTVVGGADGSLLQAIAGRHAALGASWYGDKEDHLFKGLKMAATPAVVGIREGKVGWTLYGTQHAEQMERIVRGWLNR